MITFIGMSERSSGIIRGKQISKSIENSNFFDISSYNIDFTNQIAIFVRAIDENYAKFLKSKNKILGYDLLDKPATDFLYKKTDGSLKHYVKDFFDFYIVNNTFTKVELQKFTNKKIYVIPHHNCNFDKKVKEKKRPINLGYIGVPENTISQDYLNDFCKKNNLQFITKNPQTHEDLEDEILKIDVGIVFFKNNLIYEKNLKFKPNIKLTNFQSFGIPTICLPYESYKQFGGNQCIFVETIEELQENIINLVKDEDLFQTMSKNSIKVAENYHISKVIEYYQQIAKDFCE